MSLFQCENCGCVENTALSFQGIRPMSENFDFTGMKEREGLRLCSACAPTKFSDGEPSGLGKWHCKFPRIFLPKGKFKTNRVGNLEHIETGEEDYRKYSIFK